MCESKILDTEFTALTDHRTVLKFLKEQILILIAAFSRPGYKSRVESFHCYASIVT